MVWLWECWRLLGWGIGDFYGGVASRRWPPLLVVLGSMGIATLVLLAALLLRGSALILSEDLAWALGSGAIASVAILGFYHLLAKGNMSVNAPITALTATTIPVLFGIATSGLPGTWQISGILLALVAIVLIGFNPSNHTDPHPRTAVLQTLIQTDLGWRYFWFLYHLPRPGENFRRFRTTSRAEDCGDEYPIAFLVTETGYASPDPRTLAAERNSSGNVRSRIEADGADWPQRFVRNRRILFWPLKPAHLRSLPCLARFTLRLRYCWPASLIKNICNAASWLAWCFVSLPSC